MQPLAIATRRRALGLGGAAVLLAGAALLAWLLVSRSPARAPARTVLPAGTAAQQVAIQPETGDFELPSPAQLRALEAGLAPRAQGALVVRTRPDGGQYVDVRGRFLNYAVARRTPDGKLEQGCTTDLQALQNHPASAAPTVSVAPPIAEVK
jgi:hypothetical protein